jgi:hypothetical protein
MTETRDPSQALARRWFQKAENDLHEEEVREAVEAAYAVRAWVCSRLGLE